jgi:hypothetical protein
MKSLITKINANNPNLYCFHSNEKISLGEKYILVFEKFNNKWVEKTYKVKYKDFINIEEENLT